MLLFKESFSRGLVRILKQAGLPAMKHYNTSKEQSNDGVWQSHVETAPGQTHDDVMGWHELIRVFLQADARMCGSASPARGRLPEKQNSERKSMSHARPVANDQKHDEIRAPPIVICSGAL